MRYGALTIDVDTLNCYYNTYGIEEQENNREDVIFTKALPRFLDLFEELGIKATFFVVGKDATKKCNKPILKRLNEEGHEIANHSMNHIHQFSDISKKEKSNEIMISHKVLKKYSEFPIVGFRTPGYDIDEETIHILDENGYKYDSSINPTFLSPLIKLKVMSLSNWKNKSNGMGKLSYMFSPCNPYHPKTNSIRKGGE